MKKMTGILVALAIISLLIVPATASDVTYKFKSTVYDNTDSSLNTGDFYWDADSFSGFWYQMKPGLSSELLYFNNSVNSSSTFQLGDTLAEGDLYYVSKPQVKKTKIGGSDDGSTFIVDDVDLKKYYLLGFFGSSYVAMPEDPSDLSAGCKPDKIAKILVQYGSDDKKQMFSGEEWELADGWSLVAQQVDVEGEKVWIQLMRDGEEVDSDVISGNVDLTKPERTYLYKDSDDNPVFYCYVDSIFSGTDSNFVVFKYAYLISDITTIESGDTYGVFDVDGFKVPAVLNGTDYAGSNSNTVLNTGDDAIVMSSNDDISLDPDEVIDLYGGMYLKTEDTSGSTLKMTFWKTCTVSPAEGATEVKYKIRSNLYDNTDSSLNTGDFYWDANSFSGFWYQIKPGLSSELLYFNNSVNSSSTFKLGDTIEEGDLYYVSKPQMKKTKIGGSDDGSTYIVDDVDLKKYYLLGFFGSSYIAMPEDPSSLSTGCNPDKIAKILVEYKSDNKKQMFSGEEWELADGWSLLVQQVDVEGDKVWVQLNRDGEEVDSDVISGNVNLTRPERTYLYKDSDDNPVFYCYVDSIFRGADSDFVVFKYAFLRGDITTIETGSTYGAFEVDGFEVPPEMDGTDYAGSGSGTVLHTGDDAIVMSNTDDIALKADQIIDLYSDIYIKTEDTSGSTLKMSLWKTCAMAVSDVVAVDTESSGDEEVVVVDMGESGEEAESESSVADEDDASAKSDEDEPGVESSVGAPGFELVLGILGLICAVYVSRD